MPTIRLTNECRQAPNVEVIGTESAEHKKDEKEWCGYFVCQSSQNRVYISEAARKDNHDEQG
ncbi:hypothetical protein M3699_08075 [Peribacillus simplex]|uniref:hypothetical protein n=1 Tax=Peribacillus simplex TaxID=1478 RepID=UPI00203CAF1A|nr:hypothetical protein [Peribacillus simplex]MCM3673841.1 hypothetical protein [Peribacillus simplex]